MKNINIENNSIILQTTQNTISSIFHLCRIIFFIESQHTHILRLITSKKKNSGLFCLPLNGYQARGSSTSIRIKNGTFITTTIQFVYFIYVQTACCWNSIFRWYFYRFTIFCPFNLIFFYLKKKKWEKKFAIY